MSSKTTQKLGRQAKIFINRNGTRSCKRYIVKFWLYKILGAKNSVKKISPIFWGQQNFPQFLLPPSVYPPRGGGDRGPKFVVPHKVFCFPSRKSFSLLHLFFSLYYKKSLIVLKKKKILNANFILQNFI